MRNGYAEYPAYGVPPGYYDRDGKPIPLMEWADLFGTGYSMVAQTVISPTVWVSTIWRGVPAPALMPPPGLIFETIVFVGTAVAKQVHDTNLDDAIETHDMVASAVAQELRQPS